MRKILFSIIIVFLLVACQVREEEPLVNTVTQQESATPDKAENNVIPTSTVVLKESMTPTKERTSTVPTKIVTTQVPAIINDVECLPPLETFAFNPATEGVSGPSPTQKLPSGNWNATTTIFDNIPLGNPATLEVLQVVDGKDRIWVIFYDTEKYRITYYQTGSDRWEEVKYATESSISNPHIFLDNNNSVWVALNRTNYEGISTNATLLSIYDEADQQFKAVFTLKDLSVSNSNQTFEHMKISHLQMDSQGDMWFILTIDELYEEVEYQLYKFSPSSRILERHLDDLKLDYYSGESLVISPENVLYLLDTQKDNLISYDPIKGKVEEIKIPGEVSSISSLFLDNHHKVWINDRFFLDLLNDDWYLIINPPDFIFYDFGRWTRTRPTYSLQTEDGRLWYSALYRGSGWVNPNTGKWCLYTSYPSNTVKDSEGHLWIIADGKLYRNSLQQ